MSIVWHYTTGECFRSIVNDGYIDVSRALVPIHERPIVWFSSNETWEHTATKAIRINGLIHRCTFEEMTRFSGVVRIGVTRLVAKHGWPSLGREAHMTQETMKGLERAAKAVGATPGKWSGTFSPVPRSRWSAVDVWHEGHWVTISLDAEATARMQPSYAPNP